MKKTLFAIVSLAVLAMGCVKEQQPSEIPAEKNPVSTIRISMAPTKVTVNETTGACTWQENDQIAVWFANEDATAGQRVVYTYKGLLGDGSAEFETSEAITEGYVAAKVTYPAECLNDEGGWGLIRNWEYKEGFIPMYARTEEITVNDDGSLSAQLYHNASVFKFTLHDIPAYAAGFVLEAVKYNKNEAGEFVDADGNVIDKENAVPSQTIAIKTSFPYKTGYTADPADNSNDITLYSVAAHGSYLTRVYLVDGDGSVIEGSEKKIKQSWNDVSTDDFIEFPRIDFKKADLRKDFVKVCGIKWAKGNLQYREGETVDGFQSGYRIAPAQWHYFNYEKSTASTASRVDVGHSSTQFDHFNFCGIESPWTNDAAKYAAPINYDSNGEFAMLDVMYTDQACTQTTTDYSAAKFGDIARWATNNLYRMPTAANLKTLRESPDVQYGYYLVDGKYYVWGLLFTDSLDETLTTNSDPVAFDDADLECGLFLPFAGRRADGSDSAVINTCMQGAYWSSLAKDKSTNNTYKDYKYDYSTLLQLNKASTRNSAVLYGFTAGERWNRQGGFCIRPIYRG